MTRAINRRGFVKFNTTAGLALAAVSQAPITTAKPASRLSYGPRPGVVKLDSNENPFGPSPLALQAINDVAKLGAYYAEDAIPYLKAMIAERHGLTPDHVTLSAGSSGVLCYLAVAKSRSGHILAPDLFWDTTAQAGVRQGGEIRRLPKHPDLAIDLQAMAHAITRDTALVHVTNPNNPTGLMLEPNGLRDFCVGAAKRTTVLIDEAYNEITDKPDFNTMIPLVKAGHNVVVARTFSKIYGLAGLRMGYSLSSPETAQLISRYGIGDYTLNQAGLAAAIASYNDTTFLARAKSNIIQTREAIVEATRREGLQPLQSATNFVFVDLGDLNAQNFRAGMAEHNVMIRGIYRDYANHSRVSMGYPKDVERYIAALPKVLAKLRAQAA